MTGSCPAKEFSFMSRSYFLAPAQAAAGKRGKADLTEERKARQNGEGKRTEKCCIPGRPSRWETVRDPMQVFLSWYLPRDISAYIDPCNPPPYPSCPNHVCAQVRHCA